MPLRHVHADDVPLGVGPHPAASPYDKRVSEQLGLRSFETYQVELPAGAETVRHDHLDDQVEDMYAVIAGSGWLIVGAEELAIAPGDFLAVDLEDQRHLRAGADGMTVIAVCGPVTR